MYKQVNGQKFKLGQREVREYFRQQTVWLDSSRERLIQTIRRTRESMYPSIGDQLDAIYKHLETVGGYIVGSEIDLMIKKWKKVKEDNPFPTKE